MVVKKEDVKIVMVDHEDTTFILILSLVGEQNNLILLTKDEDGDYLSADVLEKSLDFSDQKNFEDSLARAVANDLFKDMDEYVFQSLTKGLYHNYYRFDINDRKINIRGSYGIVSSVKPELFYINDDEIYSLVILPTNGKSTVLIKRLDKNNKIIGVSVNDIDDSLKIDELTKDYYNEAMELFVPKYPNRLNILLDNFYFSLPTKHTSLYLNNRFKDVLKNIIDCKKFIKDYDPKKRLDIGGYDESINGHIR